MSEKCVREDWCPYLKKGSFCQTKDDVYEETLKVMNNFLPPEEAMQFSTGVQNWYGRKYCFAKYHLCKYYLSQSEK